MEKINTAKELYKRHSRIYFAIIKDDQEKLIVRVRQTRPPNNNIATAERLQEIGHEVYTDYAKDRKLIVHTDPYIESPVEIVTGEWIKEQMNKRKIGLKGLVEALGISKTDLSSQINGHTNLGQRSRAMFYYYFKSLNSN